MQALIIPRTLAVTILMPVLGLYASLIAMFGGGLFCWLSLDIPPATFVQRIREVVPITDVWVGLVKAPVFGMLIAITGCYRSEEHTSELQSLMRISYAVFCLKTTILTHDTHPSHI